MEPFAKTYYLHFERILFGKKLSLIENLSFDYICDVSSITFLYKKENHYEDVEGSLDLSYS